MKESARKLTWSIVLLLAAACGGEEGTTVDSADGELEEPRRKGPEYKPAPVTAAGTITGTVSLASTAPAPAAGAAAPQSSAPASPPQSPAAGSACPPPSTTAFAVFLEDIPTGLPLADDAPRRHEISVGECEVSPAVSIATASGTVNLSNSLGRVHHVAFTFEGLKNPMLRVPFSDRGQLVPSERVLAVPGIVDVTSDQHPSARARIVVLEHPYGRITADGRFTLDSVPPGTYTLVAVNATGRAEARVQVQAGATTNVTLQLPPR